MHIPKDESLQVWIKRLERQKKLYKFYQTDEWLRLRADVLHDAHGECVWCKLKAPSAITPAETAHHIYPVREYPALALTKVVGGKLAIVALCHDCHDAAHKRFAHREQRTRQKFSAERW